MSTKVENRELSADIDQLFELITEHLYSDDKICIRELISNASDALDKKKILCVKNKELKSGPGENCIKIIPSLPDSETKTLKFIDTGCGMTKEELIKNLSSMAHSGTKDFMRATKEGLSDASMIGQFGVGFFSAFLIADKVEVRTFAIREDDSKTGYLWTSAGKSGYSLQEIEATEEDHLPGTEITLYLKAKHAANYTSGEFLSGVAKMYNSFAAHPVFLYIEKEEEVTDPETEDKEGEEKDTKEDDEKNIIEDKDKEEGEAQVEEVKDEDEDNKKDKEKESKGVKKVKRVVAEKMNTVDPIWKRKKEEVTEEEYEAAYKEASKDWDKHLAVSHFQVEGQDLELSAVLFIPQRAPFDMFDSHKKKKNIRLYVRRVFIMDNCEEIVPDWLTFVVGLIDSEHLDLNVSREILQKSDVLKKIRKILVKKCMALFKDLQSNEPEKFEKFMDAFGKNIKLGIHEDSANRETLAGFLKYESTKREKITLDEYIQNIPEALSEEEKKSIFYISAENKAAASSSPFLEGFKKNGIEVLFLTETIDEYVAGQLKDYKGHKLVNITKAGVKVPKVKKEEEPEKTKEEKEKEEESEKKFFEAVKKALDTEVEKVVKVDHLCESPASVASTEYGWSANFERIMKHQALKDTTMHQFMMGKKVFCINMEHPIIKGIEKMDVESEEFKKNVKVVFYCACLSSGFSIEDRIGNLVGDVYGMMGNVLGIDMSTVKSSVEEKDGEGEKKEEETAKVQEID